MDIKSCRVCGESKPLSAYHLNKACKDGTVGTCRDCTNARKGQWYKDNRAARQEAANLRNRERKSQAVAMFGSECLDCKGKFHDCIFEFHHLDPSTKDINPSELWGRPGWMNELNKCVMLCANCHRLRHHNMRVAAKEVKDDSTN